MKHLFLQRKDEMGFPRDFPRVKPKGNPEENPFYPDSGGRGDPMITT